MKTSIRGWAATSVVAIGLAFESSSHAQGTIQFANSALTKIKYDNNCVLTDVQPGVVVFGVYWGTSAVDQLTLVPTLANVVVPGIINGGSVFAIPGSTEGQTVFMQIRGWDASAANFTASAHQGTTPVLQITLGPTAGPGTVIWQSATSTNPNRFKPFTISNCPEPGALTLVGAGLGFAVIGWRFRRK